MAVTHEPQLENLCIVLVKVESAYGADANPLDGLTPLLVGTGPEASIEADTVARNVVQSTFTPKGSAVGAKRQPLKFDIEAHGGLTGVGGIVNPPDYEPLLLASGMQKTSVTRLAVGAITGTFKSGETVTGGTSNATGKFHCVDGSTVVLREITGAFEPGEALTGGTSAATAQTAAAPVSGLEYRPVTDRIKDQKSALIYLYQDRILYKAPGWRGSFDLAGEAGKYPTLSFNGTGLWAAPSDVANLPDVSPADIAPAKVERTGCMLGDYPPVYKSFKFTLGGKTDPRPDGNSAEGVAEYYRSGRAPVFTIDPEQDKLANFNPYSGWSLGTRLDASLTLGETAGNRWRLHIPGLQLTKLPVQARGTVRAYQIEGDCTGSGDDEMRLTYF
jgi:hypothetical protein